MHPLDRLAYGIAVVTFHEPQHTLTSDPRIDIHARLFPTFHVPQLVYFHTSSVLQTAGWWQPQWFWGWYRDLLVSSCSVAAVSPCAPDQTGDKELQIST